jgi:hypothetical protein
MHTSMHSVLLRRCAPQGVSVHRSRLDGSKNEKGVHDNSTHEGHPDETHNAGCCTASEFLEATEVPIPSSVAC